MSWRTWWAERREKLQDAQGRADAYLGFLRQADADRTRLAQELLDVKVALHEANRAMAVMLAQAGGTYQFAPIALVDALALPPAEFAWLDDPRTGCRVLELRPASRVTTG